MFDASGGRARADEPQCEDGGAGSVFSASCHEESDPGGGSVTQLSMDNRDAPNAASSVVAGGGGARAAAAAARVHSLSVSRGAQLSWGGTNLSYASVALVDGGLRLSGHTEWLEAGELSVKGSSTVGSAGAAAAIGIRVRSLDVDVLATVGQLHTVEVAADARVKGRLLAAAHADALRVRVGGRLALLPLGAVFAPTLQLSAATLELYGKLQATASIEIGHRPFAFGCVPAEAERRAGPAERRAGRAARNASADEYTLLLDAPDVRVHRGATVAGSAVLVCAQNVEASRASLTLAHLPKAWHTHTHTSPRRVSPLMCHACAPSRLSPPKRQVSGGLISASFLGHAAAATGTYVGSGCARRPLEDR